MKKVMRIVIKLGLMYLVSVLVVIIKLTVTDVMQTRFSALGHFILFGCYAAAITAIYKYKGKNVSDSTELSLNKDAE